MSDEPANDVTPDLDKGTFLIAAGRDRSIGAVSYTHHTLPTNNSE